MTKYKVSTGLKDYEYDDKETAMNLFNSLKESSSLWESYITKHERVTWIRIKKKAIRKKRY